MCDRYTVSMAGEMYRSIFLSAQMSEINKYIPGIEQVLPNPTPCRGTSLTRNTSPVGYYGRPRRMPHLQEHARRTLQEDHA